MLLLVSTLLLLPAALAAVQPFRQNSSRDVADAFLGCTVPFAPSVCLNGVQNLTAIPQPNSTAYVVHCHYYLLSLHDDQTRQCLVVAASVQATHPQHGFLLLVPYGAKIEPGYQDVMTALGVHVIHQKHHLKVPQAGQDHHSKSGHRSWILSYQKLYVWSLSSSFSKLLILDSDSLVLENLDHLFSLPGSAIGSDCTPHAQREPERSWRPCRPCAGVLLVEPNAEMYGYILAQLATGVDKTTQQWKWLEADQTLLAESMGLPYLSPTLQLYPDICTTLGSDEALRLYPMRRASLLHYTWLKAGIKGFNMGKDPNNTCLNQFAALWQHFELQVSTAVAAAASR